MPPDIGMLPKPDEINTINANQEDDGTIKKILNVKSSTSKEPEPELELKTSELNTTVISVLSVDIETLLILGAVK